MDSQFTHIHKPDGRIDVLFPEWRSEVIEFDEVTTVANTTSQGLPQDDDEQVAADRVVKLNRKREPAWHDGDLRRLM